jgi:hypothetical protein
MADDGQVSGSGRRIARPPSGRAGYALLDEISYNIELYVGSAQMIGVTPWRTPSWPRRSARRPAS